MTKVIKHYIASNGKIPYENWFNNIKDNSNKKRIATRIERLALGNYGDYKNLGDGVYELRLFFGSGYRVYFAEVDNTIILLLCGGDKNSQTKDIKKAKEYWEEFNE